MGSAARPCIIDGVSPQSISTTLALQRHGQPGESEPEQILARVARALGQDAQQARDFESAMHAGLLPAGRILANAGASGSRAATLANCFVQPLGPGQRGLRRALRQVDHTLRSGGGVGLDLSACSASTTRGNARVSLTQALQAFEDLACAIEASGGRPAALMGTLPVDHPAAIELIEIKRSMPLPHFNLSLTITDLFMHRLHGDPAVQALWLQLARNALAQGDPGVLFIDTIQRKDNLGLEETLRSCNPCGEQPLPDWGACVLASINLTRLVIAPFTPAARMDLEGLRRLSRTGVALLDRAIDQAVFPWPQQTALARAQRRIGLGVLGLGDALIMLGLRYDSPVARAQAAALMQEIQCAAWETSIARARTVGATTACPAASLLHAGHSASRLPADLQSGLRRYGSRNTHLTSIAPTGVLALAWADNASPSIEPVFAHEGDRLRRDAQGALRPMGLSSPALRLWRAQADSQSRGPLNAPPCAPSHPPAWQTVDTVTPSAQIAMVAALQPWVDASISKTLALPADATPDRVSNALRLAWRCGLKGLAVYRMPAWPCG
ncbi:MAG: hypothetical protein RLZ51_2276 [Pseudomonadota bacterium]